MKLLKTIGNILGVGANGETTNGLLSVLKEKTGKISFRRSASTIVLTVIVAPDVIVNGLTWINAVVIMVCLLVSCVKINIGK